MSSKPLDEMLDEHLSLERLTRYRTATGGSSTTRALNGYIWNALMSAALLELISYVEIPLRNALACELAQMAADTGEPREWWEHREWFHERSLEDIDRAIFRLQDRGRTVSHGRLVAELNLGFWRYLLDKRHDRTLWRKGLYRAFPGLTGSRAEIYDIAVDLNQLRNRIAHHEPIFRHDHSAVEGAFLQLLGWICDDYRAWASKRSRVGTVLALKPAGLA